MWFEGIGHDWVPAGQSDEDLSLCTSDCDLSCICGRRLKKMVCKHPTNCDNVKAHAENEDGLDNGIIKEGEDLYVCYAPKPAHLYPPFECCKNCNPLSHVISFSKSYN